MKYPHERDACGMFCVFGYPHVSACVIGQVLATARPQIPWRVVCGPHYACVLGNGFIVDACAAYYEYDAAKQLAEDVRNGVFPVVPCFGEWSPHATQVGKSGHQETEHGPQPADHLQQIETPPNRDPITKTASCSDKEGSDSPRPP